MLKICLLVSLCLFMSCSQKTSNNVDPIREKLGENYKTSTSPDGKYQLFFTEKDNKTNTPAIKYIVTSSDSKKIILEGNMAMGRINWLEDSRLEILDLPGIIKDSQSETDFIKIINLNQQP